MRMTSKSKKRLNLFDSEEGDEIKAILIAMTKNDAYSTEPSYSANAERYPDNLIPFVDKHMNYLNAHSNIDPRHYIANLRLMTRVS
jgi:hypothetical protein